MSGWKLRPPRIYNATRQRDPRLGLRSTACLLIVALIAMSGCTTPKEPAQKPAAGQSAAETRPPVPPPEPGKTAEPVETKPQSLEGSGEPAWAVDFKGEFIAGLDGGLYLPYEPFTIQNTQQALTSRGLYTGPINGVLDSPTMQAIYAFQKATHILQLCGVPTPRTRKMLEQGSHTDPVPG